MHKHKKKKHHKHDLSDAEEGATKAKRTKTKEEEELDKLEAARAQLKAELNGSAREGSALNAINLIAEGYGSESEEEGEIEHDVHQQQLRRAREILEDIQKTMPSQVSRPSSEKVQKGGSPRRHRDYYSDHSEEVIDVDDEFDARNYRTVVLSDRANEQIDVEEETALREKDDGSDVEIIEELTEGPPVSLDSARQRKVEKSSSGRDGDRKRKRTEKPSRKSPHRSVFLFNFRERRMYIT